MISVGKYPLFSSLIFIVLSCSTLEKINGQSSISVVQTKVNTWFDLMPGLSPGKFHLKGEIKLANSNSNDIKNLKLKLITVYYNEEVIYTFKPYFNPRVIGDEYSLKINRSKKFSFGTESGMKIDSRLAESNVVDIKLNFTFGLENFMYEIKDVEIMRVY